HRPRRGAGAGRSGVGFADQADRGGRGRRRPAAVRRARLRPLAGGPGGAGAMTDNGRRWVRGFVDYAGLAFFIIALVATRNLVQATWGLVAGAVAAVAAGLVFERRVPPMALVTAAMAVIFGTLTLALHDPRFIKMKPTILYAGFALFLLVGLARRQNPLR